jgi:hypothetical protein
LLEGDADESARAAQARMNTSCPVKTASISAIGRGIGLTRHGDPGQIAAQLRAAPPLPETADELCAVARGLGVEARHIHLGADATVPEVERLSASRELLEPRAACDRERR